MSWTTPPWWQWPPIMTTKLPYLPLYDQDQPPDQGLFYLWSPLVIFSVVLACVVGIVLIVLLAHFIYNYCTYGICCSCPGFVGSQSNGFCCCPCMESRPTKVIRRRRLSSYSAHDVCHDSIRSHHHHRPRSQIMTVNDSPCNDDVVVVSQPKVVRIADVPTVHSVRVRRPVSALSEICLAPQDLPQPVIIQSAPSVIHQPATIRPIVNECPKPPSELRVIIGNAQQVPSRSNKIVYSMNQAPSLSCQISRNQPNEYVLTSVDGNGMNSGGFSTIRGGCDCYDRDDGSCMSDGRSTVIDIGGGQRNSFYPTLPHYDD